MPLHSFLNAAAALSALATSAAINNGLGSKPGIGWNSDYCSNCVGARVDEDGIIRGFQNDAFVRHIADFLVSSGLADMGYVNVNMDAGWDTFDRDGNGNLVPDPTLWPDGINATIAYVHSVGLKFGVYGDRGTLDCSKRPGQQGHEEQDAQFYASLEVDWFKEDSCYAPGDQNTSFTQYGLMRDALNKTGRPIWFALCGWEPWYAPAGQSLGNSWRVGADTGSGWGAVMSNTQSMLSLGAYAGATSGGGGWNDMSLMLLPGMGSGENTMSQERHRSQFNLHVIFAANMLLTGNLSSIDPYALETWGNAEAVAVNQDPHYTPFIVLPIDNNSRIGSTGATGGYVDANVAECGGEPALQNWTFNTPAPQFLHNAASNQCLNVDDCGSIMIYDTCTTNGTTCAGPNKFNNQQWTLNAAGALVSALPGARCATVMKDNTVQLTACASPLTANQTWSYSATSGQLQTAGGLCLTATQPAPPTGIEQLLVLRVRDLWLHADINTTQASRLDIPLAPNGASALWKLTPIACAEDADCNLNGVCDVAAGSCTCDAGWVGPNCAQLNLSSAMRGAGTCDPTLNGTATGYTTTWGGNPVRDASTGVWHLFPAEMALHCGMCAWGSQSQIAHYTSTTMTGPYTRAGTAVGPFTHNPVVVPVPSGTGGANVSYLLFHIGLGCNSVGVHQCNYSVMPSCENGTTPLPPVPTGSNAPPPQGSFWGGTHVAASLDAEWLPMPGDWSVPRCGNNPAPLFLTNGSLMLLCHEPMVPDMSCPNSAGLSMATSVTANWTHGNYTFQCLNVLNPTLTVNGTQYVSANEDPHLYADARGNLHILTHNQGPGYQNLSWFGGDVRGDGGHFFSSDSGATWRFTWHAAYSGAVDYVAGGSGQPPVSVRYKRERPKLVQDPDTLQLIGLCNGVSLALVDRFEPGNDAACTLVVDIL